jgi:hypothetical protein
MKERAQGLRFIDPGDAKAFQWFDGFRSVIQGLVERPSACPETARNAAIRQQIPGRRKLTIGRASVWSQALS